MEHCPNCGGEFEIIAAILEAPVIEKIQQGMVGLACRCGYQKALVAISNKHARMIWAMLARDEAYDPQGGCQDFCV